MMIQIRYRKLFIGGIGSEVTETELKEYFEKYGPVTGCTIHRNRDTGRSRGFGFITFRDASSVDTVQSNRPHVIKDCEVTTKRAVPRELFAAFDGLLTVNKVFVGGLPHDAQESDLQDYFDNFGSVRRVEILVDRRTNQRRGFAFVEFDDYDPVDKVVMMQGSHVIRGHDVTVKKAKSRLEMELIRHQSSNGLDPKSLHRPFSTPLFPSATPLYHTPRAFMYNRAASGDSFECPFHSERRGRVF